MKNMKCCHTFYIAYLSIMLILPTVVTDKRLHNLSAKVLEFCHHNGMKYLTYITNTEPHFEARIFLQISTSRSKRSTYTRLSTAGYSDYADKLIYDQDNLVIVSTMDSMKIKTDLEIISSRKIMTTVMVIIDPIDEKFILKLKDMAKNMSKNMFFYLIYNEKSDNERILFKRVIAVQNNEKVLIQNIDFHTNGKMKSNYDLEGMHIPCITLSWAPFAELTKCNLDDKKNCVSEGYLPELLDLVAKKLNFTWHCDEEPNGDWGVIPNATGAYGGVMGKISNGLYPLGVSFWINIESRIGLFDFVVTGRGDEYLLALIPKLPEYDSTLFTRPFSDEAWWTIGITNIVLIFCLIITWIIPRWCGKLKVKGNSFRLVKSTIWLTYLLITIYYGGALKMFFTTEITIPFQSLKEVLLAYPEWKLRFRNGNDVLFHKKSQTMNDIIYDEFWERTNKNPQEVKFSGIEEGIQYLQEDQVVIHISDGLLKQYYKNNPSMRRPKTFSSEGEKFGENMIVTENSPLGPILTNGFQTLYENGIVDLYDKKWRGKDISSYNDGYAYAAPLNEGQLMMPFAILCVVIFISTVLLVSEYSIKYFYLKEGGNPVSGIKQ